MRTPREIISSISDDPLTMIFIFLTVVVLFVVYTETEDADIREKWHKACVDMGGEPRLDKSHRGIGDSICLKPNSILTVPDNE